MDFRDKNQAVVRREWLCLLVTLAMVLASCAPQGTSPSPDPTPTNGPEGPTHTAPATTPNVPSLLKAGQRYSDARGDMAISFLDVIGFQATVDEESELLEVEFQMRDIPPTASLEQTTDFIQFAWA